jgi:hypothetical protein
VFALIERLSLGEIATRVLHEVGLGFLAAKAVGMASVRRIDSAIRPNVLLIGKTPGTLIAEFASHGISRGGKSKHKCKRKGRLGDSRHGSIPCRETCEIGSHTAPVAEGLINLFQPNWFRPLRGAFLLEAE